MSRVFLIPILLFLALIFVVFLLLPKYENFNDLKERVEKTEVQYQKTEKYFLGLKESLENLRNYRTSLEKIETALPESPELPPLLDFLQKKSSESGLLLENIIPTKIEGKTEEEKKTEEILTKVEENYYNLKLAGVYPSFKSFLKTLEKSSRLIEVENISLSVKEKEEISEINLLIKTYTYGKRK
ncbi:MAG: type 4a pilus biogenesis protein PilO [Patescibacteria group bacterium]|nr:type 4a pilus biogenesis protein PilO [Patescibacteria group bacterium]